MAVPVLPSLIGQAFPIKGPSPNWPTVQQKALGGKRTAVPLQSYPTYSYEISFNVLRTALALAELQTLRGFINSVQGPAQLWAYSDPNDNSVTNQEFGLGDGTTTSFQLVRAFGGFAEPVWLPVQFPTVMVSGTPTTSYLLSPTGSITFASAPASGAPLTWTGSYYWPCRFDEEVTQFENNFFGFFKLQSLKFSTEKLDTSTGGVSPVQPSQQDAQPLGMP
jgi:uncharacterized protein (TIGR02217 family)